MTKHTRFTATQLTTDSDNRTVSCAISSTAPVQRGRFVEILLHGRENVNLSRLSSGRAPVLLDHDPARQVGVVQSVSLDPDTGVLRGILRFGKSKESEVVLQDIRDGIRANISVGYSIEDSYMSSDGTECIVTKWAPLEVSVVSIPADETVGFGRALQLTDHKMTTQEQTKPIGPDHNDIASMIELGRKHNMVAEAAEAVRRKTPLSEFRATVLDSLGSRSRAIIPPDHQTDNRRSQEFNLGAWCRAKVTGDTRGAEYEMDIASDLTRAARGVRGTAIPVEALSTRAAMTTAGVAAPLQAIDHRGDLLIDALLPSSVCLQAGAVLLQGLQSDVNIPREATAPAAAWVGESGTIAEGNPVYGTVPLRATMLAARVTLTRKALLQSIPALDEMVKRSIARQMATAVDKAAISGSGTAPTPRGIENIVGINSFAAAAAGTVAYTEVLRMWQEVANDNVSPDASMSFLCHPTVARILRGKETFTGSGIPIMGDMIERPRGEILAGSIMGRPAFETTHVTATMLLFGRMNDMMIGQFGPLDFVIDETTGAANGEISIYCYSFWDIAFRNGAQAFCRITGI